MSLSDYLEFILGILEDASLPAIPLDSRMGEPVSPGFYYAASWEMQFAASADREHGLLRLELRAVDSCLADALALANQARATLSESLGMRLVSCSVASFSEGERATASLVARIFF